MKNLQSFVEIIFIVNLAWWIMPIQNVMRKYKNKRYQQNKIFFPNLIARNFIREIKKKVNGNCFFDVIKSLQIVYYINSPSKLDQNPFIFVLFLHSFVYLNYVCYFLLSNAQAAIGLMKNWKLSDNLCQK